MPEKDKKEIEEKLKIHRSQQLQQVLESTIGAGGSGNNSSANQGKTSEDLTLSQKTSN
jgi:hypothetical protein